MVSDSGKEFIDFFAGAGALNYGHNNPYIMTRVMEYLQSNGILHALDIHTTAKEAFMEAFQTKILQPRGLNYKVQFCGPTGTNATEAAIRLARKKTGRPGIFSFMGGYHGMSAGSLAATGNIDDRKSVSGLLPNVVFFPYPCQLYQNIDTIDYMEHVLTDDHSGVEKPAAIIYETVQAEGGINLAEMDWYRRLRDLCDRHDILLICDDVQVGCYRTGKFFSFEHAGIVPDMVVLSKSISGCGFPMALMLMKPELDVWEPGEYSGTFRGYQLAMVGAKAAIEFGEQYDMPEKVAEKAVLIQKYLEGEILPLDSRLQIRGLGMVWGIDFSALEEDITAREVSDLCYEKGLIIETAGRQGNVLKLIPSLTIEPEQLTAGLDIIRDSIKALQGSSYSG